MFISLVSHAGNNLCKQFLDRWGARAVGRIDSVRIAIKFKLESSKISFESSRKLAKFRKSLKLTFRNNFSQFSDSNSDLENLFLTKPIFEWNFLFSARFSSTNFSSSSFITEKSHLKTKKKTQKILLQLKVCARMKQTIHCVPVSALRSFRQKGESENAGNILLIERFCCKVSRKQNKENKEKEAEVKILCWMKQKAWKKLLKKLVKLR